MKWTSRDIVDALRGSFGLATSDLHTEEWSLFTEVPLRAPRPGRQRGGRSESKFTMNERIIDVLLVRNWSAGHGHERLAVEIKVSRSDYKNESDLKRAPAEHSAHRCVYAAPAGLIDPTTLPAGWGLIEVYETVEAWQQGTGQPVGGEYGTRCRWRVKATRRDPECNLDYLVAAVARQGGRALERLRRGEDDVAEVPVLRAEAVRLQGMLDRRDAALAREQERAKAARLELLALDGAQECADCADPIVWQRGGQRDMTWVHRDPHQERTCREARTEANRLARESATGARYLSGWPDPVEPRVYREQRAAQDAEDARRDANGVGA